LAGHSQFKNIMHRKGKQDKVRSKIFGKLGREITVAAKLGMPDPAMNPRLRMAVLAARAENMPKDNIERAIKKLKVFEITDNTKPPDHSPIYKQIHLGLSYLQIVYVRFWAAASTLFNWVIAEWSNQCPRS
jgi:hypothetical protein